MRPLRLGSPTVVLPGRKLACSLLFSFGEGSPLWWGTHYPHSGKRKRFCMGKIRGSLRPDGHLNSVLERSEWEWGAPGVLCLGLPGEAVVLRCGHRGAASIFNLLLPRMSVFLPSFLPTVCSFQLLFIKHLPYTVFWGSSGDKK